MKSMKDNNGKPIENSGNGGNDPIPQNILLIWEGVKAVLLDKAYITIGRSAENMIVVDDPRVSRHHATIRVIRRNFVIFDLNSSGGTFLNGQRIGQGILYSGDLISLAGVNFVVSKGRDLRSRVMDTYVIGPGMRNTVVFDTSKLRKDKYK